MTFLHLGSHFTFTFNMFNLKSTIKAFTFTFNTLKLKSEVKAFTSITSIKNKCRSFYKYLYNEETPRNSIFRKVEARLVARVRGT